MRNFYELSQMPLRVVSAVVLVLVLAVSAGAYTIVMRDGRRIEISSHFVVTPKTLTYEVSDGFQITLQMALIDIAATEKANNETPGALLKRVYEVKPDPPESESAVINARGRRTITNRDLEPAMRRRRQSELAYETRRRELGLPTLEQSRRQAAFEEQVIGAELQQKRSFDRETENYWRTRASALRTEMAALDAEMNYLTVRLDEIPTAGSTSFSTIVPYGYGGRSYENVGGRGTYFPGAGNTRRQPGWGTYGNPQANGRVGLGRGGRRSQVLINPGNFPYGIGSPYGWPDVTGYESSAQLYDSSYERRALITRFNELAGARAGLNARWRQLEDEARRAGAPPGWLRP